MEPEHKLSPPKDGTTWIANFDIGRRNFAFCIEEINLSEFEQISNIPLKERYNKDGSLRIPFTKIINNVTMNGTIIALEHEDT